MLTIHCSPTNKSEREYICRVLLHEFLGLEYHVVWEPRKEWSIAGENGNELQLPDILFQTPEKSWLAPESLPGQPLFTWNTKQANLDCQLIEDEIPVIYGNSLFPEQHKGNKTLLSLPIDIFGSCFFMLSRYEELVIKERDRHDRFPAVASLAHKNSFLDRPIVDEYLEILWSAIKNLWPGTERKKRMGRIRVTCDVDMPFDPAVNSLLRLAGSCGGDLLIRRSPDMFYNRLRNALAWQRQDYRFDPYYTFNWYMDTCENAGHRASFYFMSGRSSGAFDGKYRLTDKHIQKLLKKISSRGHEIGMHGSYNSFRSCKTLQEEKQALMMACRKCGLNIFIAGNRQHFLRWDTSQTPDHLDAAGFSYDTSGSFADRPGFRYGTAMEFPMWSWQRRSALTLRQIPLIVMECSVIARRYLDLGYSENALNLMTLLRDRSLKFGGDFTLLWHNSHLTTEQDKEFFNLLIS